MQEIALGMVGLFFVPTSGSGFTKKQGDSIPPLPVGQGELVEELAALLPGGQVGIH